MTASSSATAKRYKLMQRERITSALVLQTESISATELAEVSALRPWLARLLAWWRVEQSGRTNATRCSVPPALLREAGLDALTTLTRVQPHGCARQSSRTWPDSRTPFWRRLGPEVPERSFRRARRAPAGSGSSPAWMATARRG